MDTAPDHTYLPNYFSPKRRFANILTLITMKNIIYLLCLMISIPVSAQIAKCQSSKTIKCLYKKPKQAKKYERFQDAFSEWIADHPLKKDDVLKYHTGAIKYIAPNDVYDAVFDYEIGPLDLHQCADAAMYLWASYNYSNGPEFYERLVFNGADGTEYNYLGYLETSGKEDNCKTFRRWLDLVWTYANTWSISEYNLVSVPIWDIQPGDVLIVGGFPGHAVSVVDVLLDSETGHKYFMLAQSFMPAQENHILKNPATGDVWYQIEAYMTHVRTPQYTFHINDLKRWRNR